MLALGSLLDSVGSRSAAACKGERFHGNKCTKSPSGEFSAPSWSAMLRLADGSDNVGEYSGRAHSAGTPAPRPRHLRLRRGNRLGESTPPAAAFEAIRERRPLAGDPVGLAKPPPP